MLLALAKGYREPGVDLPASAFFSLMISKELVHKVQRESVHLVEAD